MQAVRVLITNQQETVTMLEYRILLLVSLWDVTSILKEVRRELIN